ncbi:hypothetical protein PG991_016241 [Apiospora marii]|uniref:Uncharacterized protein n=1 Tax=Apiospora marii TaxID=335849 RepID=A0ABR1R0X4_9PEZI
MVPRLNSAKLQRSIDHYGKNPKAPKRKADAMYDDKSNLSKLPRGGGGSRRLFCCMGLSGFHGHFINEVGISMINFFDRVMDLEWIAGDCGESKLPAWSTDMKVEDPMVRYFPMVLLLAGDFALEGCVAAAAEASPNITSAGWVLVNLSGLEEESSPPQSSEVAAAPQASLHLGAARCLWRTDQYSWNDTDWWYWGGLALICAEPLKATSGADYIETHESSSEDEI